MAIALLIDMTKCLGCNACTQACKMANNLPQGVSRTHLAEVETGSFPNVRINYVKSACKHCLEPACASACTVGALRKTEAGPVAYEADKCIGCRYCMYACPFGVPKFNWQDQFALISKCDMCVNRQDGGSTPACAESCPYGAIMFGEREELLTEAHFRLRAYPDRYVPYVYGERDAGGLSVLYLSSVPFTDIGFPDVGEKSPAYVSEKIMHSTPTVAAGMALLLTGTYWAVKRRNEAFEAEAAPAQAQAEPIELYEQEEI